ncbi:RING-type domain-containing protein [Psidium guajava]|nr:RING-type domain-containing protein [Psidium guajava]
MDERTHVQAGRKREEMGALDHFSDLFNCSSRRLQAEETQAVAVTQSNRHYLLLSVSYMCLLTITTMF